MLTEPATARPMPRNFCTEPASSLRHTAIIAVKTGMVGCMQVATSTPDNEMPMMYISWLKKRHTPRALTCSKSDRFGSTPADTHCSIRWRQTGELQELQMLSDTASVQPHNKVHSNLAVDAEAEDNIQYLDLREDAHAMLHMIGPAIASLVKAYMMGWKFCPLVLSTALRALLRYTEPQQKDT